MNVDGIRDDGVPGRVADLIELGAAREGGHADLFDGGRIGRAQGAEHLRIELEDRRVATREHGRRSRISGQQRHLAEVAARRDDRDLTPIGLELRRPPRPSKRRTSNGRAPLPDDRLAVAEDPDR